MALYIEIEDVWWVIMRGEDIGRGKGKGKGKGSWIGRLYGKFNHVTEKKIS